MRTLIVAALLLSPVLLSAQAASPAPTQASELQAKLVSPAFAGSTNAHPTGPVRVSTGVVAPRLIHTVEIPSNERDIYANVGLERRVVVSMIVDETGTPNDLKIVESADPIENSNILAAVSQYRFKPGTLSNQPTPVPVNLEIILRPTR